MTDILIPLLVIVSLIALNGLFVAAEFAIVGAPRAAIANRAERGDPLAKVVHRILGNPRNQDRYIATAQLGITFASLGLGMYGEHQVAHWIAGWLEGIGAARWVAAHAVATVLAVLILTYFHVVLGEMVPKSLALQKAERTALLATPPMLAIRTLLYPLVLLLNGVGNGILRLMGVNRQERGEEHYQTSEELELIVGESFAGGLLRAESALVLQELFDFTELQAGELMVPRVQVHGLRLGAAPSEIARVLRTNPYTRYPVYEGDLDHIIGMVHVKDLLSLATEGRSLTKDVVRPVPFIPETAHLDTLLAATRRTGAQLAVVMDEHGGTAGIITTEDLFAEIVGDIREEETEPPELYTDDRGRLHVAGTVRVEEVGEQFGVELEHEDVDTVSGLVLALLDRPPEVGDVVTYGGFTFEVAAVAGHGVDECVVTYQPPAEERSDGDAARS